MKTINLILFTLAISCSTAFGQNEYTSKEFTSKEKHEVEHKHSLGASLWMLANFFEESADYYLITYGYQATSKDRFFVEFNTWKYDEPLGTYGSSEEFYPGFVRTFGIGAGYQRFLWKGLFTTVQATPFLKHYREEDGTKIQNGFQLYLQFGAGYRFEFFKKRWYVEPGYALKYWPVDTNFPDSFAAIEEGAPKHKFEFSCNFGYKF